MPQVWLKHHLFGSLAMPKRKTKGVPGRSSLPPGYQHPYHQGYVPWAKPIFQGPMIGPQPGTFYDPRMPGGWPDAAPGDADLEDDQDQQSSEDEEGSSSSSSKRAKSSRHKCLCLQVKCGLFIIWMYFGSGNI